MIAIFNFVVGTIVGALVTKLVMNWWLDKLGYFGCFIVGPLLGSPIIILIWIAEWLLL